MIAHLKELKILRAVIDGETWIDIVLITLLELFKVFYLSYSESRGFCILGRIPERLQATQGIISHQEHLQVVEKGSSVSAKKKKRLLNQRVGL